MKTFLKVFFVFPTIFMISGTLLITITLLYVEIYNESGLLALGGSLWFTLGVLVAITYPAWND